MIHNNTKYCLHHCPEKEYEFALKRKCKYCDHEDSTFVCNNCKQLQNKKEVSVIRYLRKHIDTEFVYNSSKMLQGLSKKRPDIYFELENHFLIVEIDENQHNAYEDLCECARLSEIVSGLGYNNENKPVIVIRFNPDKIKNNDTVVEVILIDRLQLLVYTIKEELVKDYDSFFVKLIQLYYDDDYEKYQPIKEEDITNLVAL